MKKKFYVSWLTIFKSFSTIVLVKVILLFIFTLLNLSCTQRFNAHDNTLYMASHEQIKSLDPVLGSDLYSHQAMAQIYEGLFHFHYLKRPITLEPLLADGFPSVSADGKTYTFKIKKNVHFQNSPAFPDGKGRLLTAKDVVYSWKRVADPANLADSYWVFQNKIVGLDEWRDKITKKQVDYTTPVEGLQTPDDHTLVVKLTKVQPQWLSGLALAAALIVPQEAVEYFGSEFGNHPVGTGPFQMESWARGSRLTLVKNPNYREDFYPTEATAELKAAGYLEDAGKKIPFLDKVVISEIAPEQPRWLLFLKGDLDFLLVSKDYITDYVDRGKITEKYSARGMDLQLVTSTDVTYISFNTENPFLKNKKLRQALSLAYDHQTSLEKFYNFLAVPAHGPIPPNLAGYRKDFKNPFIGFDVAKAKRLLAQAGYPNGKGLPEFHYEMASNHATARQMSEFFKQQMELIGVKVALTSNTWPQFRDKIKLKKADIFEMAWNADYPDAENFFQLFYSPNVSPGTNNSNFQNKTFDALYEKAVLMPMGPERVALYEQMEELLAEEAPWIYAMHRVRTFATHGWLKNYQAEMMIPDTAKYLRIDTATRAKKKKNL